jgi:5-methylthioadenosine/S-adenosylhomocysteine deaminase
MNNVDHIVYADYVLPMDETLSVITDGAVAIRDGKIIDVGNFEEINNTYFAKKMTGGSHQVIFPGLVNTHTHAAMVYFRGMADDLPLKEWLEKHIWPAEESLLSSEFVYDAVKLACLEMVKSGITLYNDMYFFKDAAALATKKVGITAVLGVGILDFPTKAASTTDEYFMNAEKFLSEWSQDQDITPAVAPHSVYTCSPATLKKAQKLAEKYNSPIHIHLAETQWERDECMRQHNLTPVAYLKGLDFLGNRVVAAHCVWITEQEIAMIAEKNTGVSHCIKSNLKLASGIAPVVPMLDSGVKVTFGTDGAASNNTLNILSEMSLAAKLHKAVTGDPTALNDKQALLMATRWGAEALGRGHITGSLEKGKNADLVMANLNKPHLTPIFDIYSHIVYAMKSSDIEMVMVNGKKIVEKGELKTLDEHEICDLARHWQNKILSVLCSASRSNPSI